MEKRILSYLMVALLATYQTYSADHRGSPGFDINFNGTIPVRVDESSLQSALISSIGFVASSVGCCLLYKAIIASSTQPAINVASEEKLDATKLSIFGGMLLAAGILTIVHTRVSNLFASQK
jgi:hypothetical protein